ncbi:MAG TPA: hypothetical protein VID48_03760 [Solirubrobacteraceae bacterium]|jgi:hypothetical protein
MGFDVSRLRRADQIVGVSAIALFIFMFFFKWYGVSSNVSSFAGVNVNVSKSGWDVFTNSRWIWLITIIVAIGAVMIAAGALKFQSPVQLSVLVAGLGALSTALILYRIIHHPTASASYGGFHASAGIKIGIWLGLIAALGITYGGYLAMQAEGTSIADVREQASGAISGLAADRPASSPTPAEGSSQAPPAPPIPPPPAAEPDSPGATPTES